MISDGIKNELKEAADRGTVDIGSKPKYLVRLTFDQLIALMEKVEDWNRSQNRD